MRGRFSIGWMALSYLMVLGGVFLAAVVVQAFGVTANWARSGVFIVGSGAAGFVAGRASRRVTIAEPVVAAVLLVVTTLVVVAWMSGRFPAWELGTERALGWWIKVASVCGFGGFVGAVAGERSGRSGSSGFWLTWAMASTLLFTGMAMGFLVLFVLIAGTPRSAGDGGIVLAALALAAAASGFATQLAARRKMTLIAGGGGVVFTAILVALSGGDMPGSIIGGCVLLAGGCLLFGALGSWLSWTRIGSQRPPESNDPPELPTARLS